MIVEYIRYTVGADQVDGFLQSYEQASASLRASPYCLGYELARCTEAPDHLILRIEWTSEKEHIEGFRTSAEWPAFLAAVGPYRANIEEMRHYARTPLTWSRGPS